MCVGDGGDKMLAARDHCGIKPLYMGYGENGSIWFASELKAICDQCDTIEEFPAGYYWTPASGFVTDNWRGFCAKRPYRDTYYAK